MMPKKAPERDRPYPDLKDSPAKIAKYINKSLAATRDPKIICASLLDAVRAQNVAEIARQAKIDRPHFYRMLRDPENPGFNTILKILDALGLEIRVAPRSSPRR